MEHTYELTRSQLHTESIATIRVTMKNRFEHENKKTADLLPYIHRHMHSTHTHRTSINDANSALHKKNTSKPTQIGNE